MGDEMDMGLKNFTSKVTKNSKNSSTLEKPLFAQLFSLARNLEASFSYYKFWYGCVGDFERNNLV